MNQRLFPAMNIIHGSMVMGLVLFFITLMTLRDGLPSEKTDFENPLIYISIMLLIFALAINYFVYPVRIQKLKDADGTLTAKVKGWRTWFLIRCAAAEAAALCCLVAILLTESSFYMYVYFTALILLISYFPSKNRLQAELELSIEEMDEIDNLKWEGPE